MKTTMTNTTRAIAAAAIVLLGSTACQSAEDVGQEQPGQEQTGGGAGGETPQGDEGFGPVGEPTIDDEYKDAVFNLPNDAGYGDTRYELDLKNGDTCLDTAHGTFCLAAAVPSAEAEGSAMTLWHHITEEGKVEEKAMADMTVGEDNHYSSQNGMAWVDAGGTAQCDSYTVVHVGTMGRNEDAGSCGTVAWQATQDENGNHVWMPVTK